MIANSTNTGQNIYPRTSPKYNPQKCMYIDGSFTPPTKITDGHIIGNTANSRFHNPNNNLRISIRLHGYQNILRAELNTIVLTTQAIQITRKDTHIFTNNLTNIHLINIQDTHPYNNTTQTNYSTRPLYTKSTRSNTKPPYQKSDHTPES